MLLVLWHRSVGWEAVAAELLLVFVLGLEGIIAYGTFFNQEIASAGQRQQLTLGLLDRFTSSEAHIARAEAWRLRNKWFQGDRSILRFFVEIDDQVTLPDEEPAGNGLTPHQCLSWLLHFYVSVQSYDEAGLLDGKLAAALFEPHYEWYRKFFQQFCEEYRKQKSAPKVEPAWLKSLPKLETLFKESGSAPAQ